MFHEIKGHNVTLDPERNKATWTPKQSGGLVFTEKPLRPAVRLALTCEGSGTIALGITTTDPQTLRENVPDGTSKLADYLFLNDLKIHKRAYEITVMLDEKAGSVMSSCGTGLFRQPVLSDKSYFIVVDIKYGTVEIKLRSEGVYSFSEVCGPNIKRVNDPAVVTSLTTSPASLCFFREQLHPGQDLSFTCSSMPDKSTVPGRYFSEEIDLSGLQVDMALRKFQSYFRMPGEAQKIERLMEVFAHRYIDCNPDQVKNFKNPETVLLLAFAIIMLNTDLHNASIKPERKMKQEDFVKNLRGIDDDEDVDPDLLIGIYERVKAQEFRPGVDHVTQVMKVEQTIVGNRKPALALPHRRLVCYCRLYQVHDPNKKEKIGLHQREVFLFNDLLLVTKIFSKKKTGITYSFKQSFSLCDMQVYLFETSHYVFGIRLVNNLDNKVLITFNARNDHDRQKFVEDLKEAVMECNGMEDMRISEQQRHNPQHTQLDRHYSNDDTRINTYDYLKTDPNSNRLSAPDYGGLKQSFPLSNSLSDLCGAQGLRRGSSGGSLDSGVHTGSTGSANSTEMSLVSQGSQSSLMKGLALTAPTLTSTSKMAVVPPNRAKSSTGELKPRVVPEGTEV